MKKRHIFLLLLFAFAVLLNWVPKADAQSSYFTANCTTSGCHAASPSTCNGCHAHGVHSSSSKNNLNVTGTTNKSSYAPGETVSVTINGGYRTSWVRAILYDQNMNELARSTGAATGGMGGGPAFPVTLTAAAPTTAGTYTWNVAWYGNKYDLTERGGTTFFGPRWTPDPNNPNHGREIVSTASFSVAAATDTTPPTVTSFTVPSASNSLTVPISTFVANDNVSVTGYAVTESSTAPTAGWLTSPPASYTFTTQGTKTLYGWARDAAGNTGNSSASATITIPPPADTTAPTVTAFTTPAVASSLTVSITSFTATDTVGVTGYLLTENAAMPVASSDWSATTPTSYTFASAGVKTLYAWAEDAAGNVSTSLSASVSITITPPPPPPPTMGSLIPPATSGIYWDDVNKTLTIDSSNPSATTNSGVATTVYASGAAGYNPQMIFEMARGTLASPAAVQTGDLLGSLGINAYNGSAWDGNRKAMQIEASEPWTPTAGGYRIVFYTRDNGTVGEPFESLRIENNGDIGIGTSTPGQKLEVNGGMMLNTNATKPDCDSTTRGTFWFTQDDINGDSADVCAKVSGSYSWKKLF